MKKLTYILTAISLVMLASCAQEIHPEIGTEENVQNLIVKGVFLTDESTEYPSVIDEEAGTVTVQVPYYLSDTEPIQGNLTQMKIRASLPAGAKFNPGISGIKDLVEGFESTLEYFDGSKKTFRFSANYVKSDLCQLIGMKFYDPKVGESIIIYEPKAEGEKGTIVVPKNDETFDALSQVVPSVSPWATVEYKGTYDASSNILDLSQGLDVTVVSQSGNCTRTYAVEFKEPERVEKGVGKISALFGWQATVSDPHGMTESDNRTIAVVGDYLILSNASDFSKMPVYDRFTGDYLGNDYINVTGIETENEIHAISTDDAGHLVAATYVSNRNVAADPYTSPTACTIARIFVWKNGIESAPTKVFEHDLTDDVFENAPMGVNGVKNLDLFRVINICGDMTSGQAVLTTCTKTAIRPVFLLFQDGEFVGKDGKAFVEVCSILSNYASLWHSTKIVAMTTDGSEYFFQSAMWRHNIMYSKNAVGLRFNPPTTHWWGQVQYQNPLRGMDVIDFNGSRLLAVQNSWYMGSTYPNSTNTQKLCVRTYVADVGQDYPDVDALNSGFIFDTREGNLNGTGDIPGTGYAPSGMTSAAAFAGGEVLGTNWPESGDVFFHMESSGNAVTMYSLTPGQGLIGYKLTNVKADN